MRVPAVLMAVFWVLACAGVCPAASRHVIVELDRVPDEAARASLRAAGVDVQRAVGMDRYIASVREGAVLPARVLAVRAIEPASKVHPLLRAEGADAPAWVRSAADRVVVNVSLHDDVTMESGARLVEGAGGRVLMRVRLVRVLVAEVAPGSVAALAAADGVRWIEPALASMSGHNAEARALTGVDVLQASPYSLSGAGVDVMVMDVGTPQVTHPDYDDGLGQDRVFLRDFTSLSSHTTHVTGTVAGSGLLSGGLQAGMAPASHVQSYWIHQVGVGTAAIADPGDAEVDYADAIRSYGVTVANNSFGLEVGANLSILCDVIGDYGVMSSLLDSIVAGSIDRPFPLVWSAGNERSVTRCGLLYDTIPPPSGAKNTIVVGSVESDTEQVSGFSSWGPTDDGRVKPDVVAPGCQVGGDGGITSTWFNSDYNVQCGTSMAAPVVTGICALLTEDFRAMFPDRTHMRPSLLKALLIQSAQDVEAFGPDYRSGFGSVRAQGAVDLLRSGSWLEGTVTDGGVYTAFIGVGPGESILKVTLAWDDAPGVVGVSPNLVNDLDLAVFDPLEVQQFPWTLDPLNPNDQALPLAEDRLNNVEQVIVGAPAPGLWRVEVRGFSVPEGPQSFSLAAAPVLNAMSVEIVDGPEASIAPDAAAPVTVRIRAVNNALEANSALLRYRVDGGAWQDVALAAQGGDLYGASLPAVSCGQSIEYYAQATGALAGVNTDPPGGALAPRAPATGARVIVFDDDMEQDLGWVVGDASDTATAGAWVRVDPVGTTDAVGSAVQPEDDHGAGVRCWVTGQGVLGGTVGAADVDGGTTSLTSPAFDLSGAVDARVSYWLWYSNTGGATPNADVMRVFVSGDDGATWAPVETLGPLGSRTYGGWFRYEFDPSMFVGLTPTMRLRFVAEDAPSGSIVEAAVDDVRVDRFACGAAAACPGDADGDGAVNVGDISFVIFRLGASGAPGTVAGDADGNGVVDVGDVSFVIFRLGTLCP